MCQIIPKLSVHGSNYTKDLVVIEHLVEVVDKLSTTAEEDYSISCKLVYNCNQMFCYRDYQLTTRFYQQNEKFTSNYTKDICSCFKLYRSYLFMCQI